MFVYVTTEEPGKWKLIAASELEAEIKKGAHFVTVLELSTDPELAEQQGQEVKYRGDWYLDFDAESLEDARLDVANFLLRLALDYGVDLTSVRIWASGGKGFHIQVPYKTFLKNNNYISNLAYTYKNMTLQFDLPTVDFNVYSQGKGRMWRIPNVKRKNGKYKVPLTATEVLTLTADEIEPLCYKPRNVNYSDPVFSPKLHALYKVCQYKKEKTTSYVENRHFLQLKSHPDCITKIVAYEELQEGKRFNNIAMVLAGYASAINLDESDYVKLVQPLAKKGKSSKYKTQKDRLKHLVTIYNYFKSKQDYTFSCVFARSVVKADCGNCVISRIAADAALGIEEEYGAYYRVQGDNKLQISTFIIKPNAKIKTVKDSEARYALNTTLISQTGRSEQVFFMPEDIISKSAFMKKMPGPDFAFFGGDVDVQKIFHYLSKLDIPEKVGVNVVGFHKIHNEWHFVTAQGSLSASGERDTVVYTDDSFVHSHLIETKEPTKDELQHIIKYLFTFNAPEVVIPVVGWHIACMFKERIFSLFRKFPILFIFGEAGSGKTTTALLLRRLFAISEDLPLKSVGDVTAFTLARQASKQNIPMYLDEYKSTSFDNKHKALLSKVMRAAYQNEEAERGRADQTITRYPYYAPLVFIGEQTVNETAVKHRIIEAQFIARVSKQHESEFYTLEDSPLEKLGKALLLKALTVTDKYIENAISEAYQQLPPVLRDRPRFNNAVVLAGIKFIKDLCEENGVSTEVIDSVFKTYYERFKVKVNIDMIEYFKTDVDRIFEVFSIMTRVGGPYQLVKGEHYVVKDGKLYIQLRLVYTLYLQYVKTVDLDTERMNWHSFYKLVIQEPYFDTDEAYQDFVGGPAKCFQLDIEAMKAKKIDIDLMLYAEGFSESTLVEIKA